jgi:hypothetical protein
MTNRRGSVRESIKRRIEDGRTLIARHRAEFFEMVERERREGEDKAVIEEWRAERHADREKSGLRSQRGVATKR